MANAYAGAAIPVHGVFATAAWTTDQGNTVAAGDNVIRSFEYTPQWEETVYRDIINNVVGVQITGQNEQLSIEVHVKGTTEATAQAKLALPKPYKHVTIANAPVDYQSGPGISPLDGTWNFISGSVRAEEGGNALINMTLARQNGSALSAPA
jgi:hypothetical protein